MLKVSQCIRDEKKKMGFVRISKEHVEKIMNEKIIGINNCAMKKKLCNDIETVKGFCYLVTDLMLVAVLKQL